MAANLRDIRRRIKSIKSTAQITKAMQMVAAAKMRKAQAAALAGRPFAELLNRITVSIRKKEPELTHPLFIERPVRKETVVVITSDRGLCGAFNTNLLRETSGLDFDNCQFVAIGRRGFQFLKRSGRDIAAQFELPDNPTFGQVRPIAKFLLEQYLEEKTDRVRVLFNTFVNTLQQQPIYTTIAPVSTVKFGKEAISAHPEENTPEPPDANHYGYVFEPSATELLETALPNYVALELHQMILDSQAAEQSARMVAMKNATENANNLVKDLTLEYNKIRQSGITNEILEIATAQMALA